MNFEETLDFECFFYGVTDFNRLMRFTIGEDGIIIYLHFLKPNDAEGVL